MLSRDQRALACPVIFWAVSAGGILHDTLTWAKQSISVDHEGDSRFSREAFAEQRAKRKVTISYADTRVFTIEHT